MTQRIHQHRFENGLVIVAEPMASAQSLAMSMLLPAGLMHEPVDRQGVAAVLSEVVCRGAGELDARAHSDALDQLGVQRSTSVETSHLHIGATMIGSKRREALPLLLDMGARPMLDESVLEPSRDLALQDLAALDDEPQQKVFIELRQRHYPQPLGRSPLGQADALAALTQQDLLAYARRCCVPDGTILGFAGKFDWHELRDQVGEHLASWRGRAVDPTQRHPAPRGYHHQEAQTTQVHIGLAYDAVPETHPDSILQRTVAAVLSGGMSGRLFTEVREKHGLCYAVYASYSGNKHLGAMLSYSGTTAPRAQQTLDILVQELRRVHDGADAAEFSRAIVGMKSRLVMQGESTGARAHAIAADQYIYGRPRTLDELAQEVDGVSLAKLNDYLAAHRPGPMTIVTLGPSALKAP
jgi:predicted Zn-dependent peptidase